MKCNKSGTLFKRLTFAGIIILGMITLYWGFNRSPEQKAHAAVKTVSYKLDLTTEQKHQFKQLMDEMLATRTKIANNRRNIRDRFTHLAADNNLNRENLLQLVTSAKEQVDIIAPQLVDKVLAFINSLDEDQRKKFIAEMKKHSKGKRNEKSFNTWF